MTGPKLMLTGVGASNNFISSVRLSNPIWELQAIEERLRFLSAP